MIVFYVGRLARKATHEERQEYLDTVVTDSLRDQVRDAYNKKYPEDQLS